MIDEALLDHVGLAGDLCSAARQALAARAVVREFEPDQVLWTAGDAPRGLFVVLDGRVRIVRAPGGRQHVVHTEGPGATIGEVPLFAGGCYPATAVAAGAVRCLVLDRDALLAAMKHDPRLAWRLLERLASRVRQLVDRLSVRSGHGVRARLARELLAREAAAGPGRAFDLGGTQTHLAEELGTVREVVVRHLRELARSGAIGVRANRRYVVTDRAALQALAADDDG